MIDIYKAVQTSLEAQWQKIRLQCRRCGFNPWVRKIPWRRKWQPTPVFLPGESHGQRSLAGYSLWGWKESDMTEQNSSSNKAGPELEPQIQPPAPKLRQELERVVGYVTGVQTWDVFQEFYHKITFFEVVGFFFLLELTWSCKMTFTQGHLKGPARHIGKHMISIPRLDVWQTCNKHNHSMITSH